MNKSIIILILEVLSLYIDWKKLVRAYLLSKYSIMVTTIKNLLLIWLILILLGFSLLTREERHQLLELQVSASDG